MRHLPHNGGRSPLLTDHRKFFIECPLVSRSPWKKAVFQRQKVVDSAFFCELRRPADLRDGSLVRARSGQIYTHTPEMNFLSVQQKIPSGNGELPISEQFGKETVDLLSVLRLQDKFQCAEIFRAIQIPEFFRPPVLNERDPLRSFFQRHKRRGKCFDNLSVFRNDSLKHIPPAPRKSDPDIQEKPFFHHVRNNAHIANLSVSRTIFQPQIPKDPSLSHIAANLHDPSRRHKSFPAVLVRLRDKKQNQFMLFSRQQLSAQIQRSTRIIKLSAESPVKETAGGGLNHFRIQQNSPVRPVFRYADSTPIPARLQIFIGNGPFPAGGIQYFLCISGGPVRPRAGDLEDSPAATGGRNRKIVRNLPVIHLQKLPQSVQAEIFAGSVFPPERIRQAPVLLHPHSVRERRIRIFTAAGCGRKPRHA